ncbi:MAG TPA: YetF domain-containing protein [Lacipirellulaceae bacterium]|nr:YetF domain-containing protein [Lacipirellulaceae bacterium]
MPTIWHNLFVPEISILEKIVRPILVYAFLIIGLRLAGKRELAQLNPFDLVVLLTISNTVQNAIIGSDNSVSGGVIGATTLLAVNYFLVRFLYGYERLDRIVEGDADVLVADGQIQHDRLKSELLTVAELETAAHRQGFASLADIDRAVLEVGGSISFIPKKPTPEVARHTEVLARLDRLANELTLFRKAMGPGTSMA